MNDLFSCVKKSMCRMTAVTSVSVADKQSIFIAAKWWAVNSVAVTITLASVSTVRGRIGRLFGIYG